MRTRSKTKRTRENLNRLPREVEATLPSWVKCTDPISAETLEEVRSTVMVWATNVYHYFEETKTPLPYKKLNGLQHLDKVIAINQSPIGRTPRSNPATYTGIFNEIRALFTKLPEAAIRGYKPGRFSFNVAGGRCEECKGAGIKTVEMNFLPDVHVECEACKGKRYNRETLEVRYRSKSISDVLGMTVNEAVEFFDSFPKLKRIAKTLQDVGLGYITLGQQSTTLSGGEAQRVKLATELARVSTGKTSTCWTNPPPGFIFKIFKC